MVLGLVLFCFFGCGEKTPNEKLIAELAEDESLNIMNYATCGIDSDIDMGISSVIIEKAQINDKQTTAFCRFNLENDDYAAIVYYKLNLVYYDKGGWSIEDWTCYDNYEISPKNGVAINIATSDVKESFPHKNICDLKVSNEELDLSTGVHKLFFDYSASSEVCDYIGDLSLKYSFNKDTAEWTLEDSLIDNGVPTAWHADGEYEVAINTYYIRFGIKNIDTYYNTAEIGIKGSVWESVALSGELDYFETGVFQTQTSDYDNEFSLNFGERVNASFKHNYVFKIRASVDGMYCVVNDRWIPAERLVSFPPIQSKHPTAEENNDDSVGELVDSSLGYSSIDENTLATMQANVSNWGVACKAKEKVFYSDVCTGIYIHNQNEETLFTEGVYTDLYYLNNKIYCVEDVAGKMTLVSFDYDTKEKQTIYTPKSEYAVIIVYNMTSEKLYFSVDEQLFYLDSKGDVIDTGIFNVVNVTDSGIYSKTTPKFGLKLTTFENVVIKKFTCVDDYNVIVFFEKDGFVYVELTDEDYTSREYARISLEDGYIEMLGKLLDDAYRGINVKDEMVFFSSSDETTLSIYRTSLSLGDIEKIYSTEIEGGIGLGLIIIIDNELFAVSPYSTSGVKILDINSF